MTRARLPAVSTAVLDRPITDECRLATEFLSTITDPRLPWLQSFTAWAAQRGLSEADAKAVRICCLRLRTFGAIERHTRRRRR